MRTEWVRAEGCCRNSTFSAVRYGDCRNSQGDLGTDKLFTGQRLDDTGLYYYGARYYDPTIGRFISPDTIVQNPANPQSLNRYSYVLNNPLKYVDPTGLIVEFENEEEILQLLADIEEDGGTLSGELLDMVMEWAYLRLGWEELSDAEADMTRLLDESPITYTLSWGYAYGAPAITEATGFTSANIIFDKSMIQPNREGVAGIAWVAAHESIHAAALELERQSGLPFGGPSKYEEAIAGQFQNIVRHQLGYSPGADWTFWNDATPMQSAYNVSKKSTRVDLSLQPTTLSDTLNRVFYDTTNRPLYPLPRKEYLGVMTSLVNTFIR